MNNNTTTNQWAKLVKADPRLGDLLDEASTTDDADSFCAKKRWRGEYAYTGPELPKGGSFATVAERVPKVLDYKLVKEGIYNKLGKLLGWNTKTAAYEVAIKVLMKAIPPCRNCSCRHQRWRKHASVA